MNHRFPSLRSVFVLAAYLATIPATNVLAEHFGMMPVGFGLTTHLHPPSEELRQLPQLRTQILGDRAASTTS